MSFYAISNIPAAPGSEVRTGPGSGRSRGKSMKILWHHPEKYSLEVSMRVSQYVSILFYVQAHYFGCISQLPRIVFSGPTINQNSMFNHDHEPKITLNPIYVPIFVGSVLPITWGLKPYCWWYSQLYIPWNHTYCGLNPPNISSWFHQYHQLTFQSYPVNIPIN
jgi:hypothetical protein